MISASFRHTHCVRTPIPYNATPGPSATPRRSISSIIRPSFNALIHIPKANVYRFGDANNAEPVFKDVEWTAKDGENWAIVGSAGREKTDFLDMLRGYMRFSPPPPSGLFPFLTTLSPHMAAHDAISHVSFTSRPPTASGGAFFDYTARYGAVRDEDRLTLRDTLFSEIKSKEGIHELETLAEKLDLKGLLDLPFIVLSNGQTRRARIAKALLGKPELLLLDEPLTGLDVNHRPQLTALLHELHGSRKPRILMALRPQDPLPEWITHVVLVEGQHVRPQPRSHLTSFMPMHIPISASSTKSEKSVGRPSPVRSEGKELVRMKDVNVRYHERHVLKNITWTIRSGERWHLRGPNGSGKTTLLSLLTGSHPQSYTQPAHALTLFSRPRRQQPTTHLQTLVGHASPEILAAFPRKAGAGGLSAREAIATGFEGTFAYRRRNEEEERRVDEVIRALGPSAVPSQTPPTLSSSSSASSTSPSPSPSPLPPSLSLFAQTPFALLPPAHQSLTLLMRALIARPPLLILDEVFAGMDARMVARARQYLREEVSADQAVVFVSHWEEEVPWGDAAEGGGKGDGLRRIRLVDGEAFVE